jgi:hypothetical protein
MEFQFGDNPERGYLRIEVIPVGHIQEWRYLRMELIQRLRCPPILRYVRMEVLEFGCLAAIFEFAPKLHA